MAAPMRPGAQDAGHRAPRVADSSTAPPTASSATTPSANFEYDDNEWDIGIGDLIIDLDADIEKTTEKSSDVTSMAANAGGPQATKAAAAKMAVEHSATVQDKGIKLKIKRTKPGTKTSEAKHEIVKSNEQQNGATDPTCDPKSTKASTTNTAPIANNTTTTTPTVNSASKRGSSGHRRDKKHDKPPPTNAVPSNAPVIPSSGSELNGVVRVSVPQTGQLRPVFPGSTGPGPPCANQGPSPGPPPSPAAATAQGSAAKPEQAKGAANPPTQSTPAPLDDRTSSPPPAKKMKTESKEVNDVCVGTSVGTITEPDCLGPCEPGTSVTLEGIVWHETEGGVLVVNVTWRGKTYVGTLLDCTRHDWAPPRFCDSPTSDLDNRTPKGRETRSSVHSKLRNGGGGAKGRRGGTNGQGPSSPTPFIPPRPESSSNKRKSRADEEAPQQTQTATATNVGKKTKVVIPPPTLPIPTPTTVASASIMSSPPSSPVLLECPEPNCSKKYKHINGLKYHQSHAHNSADDDDTKDVTSMSENDESNIEAPSPITPVKSPEPSQDSSPTTMKKEGSGLLEVSSEPNTPRSTPPLSLTPQETTNSSPSPAISSIDSKSVVKPGILRFNPTEEYPVGVFSANKSPTAGSTSTNVLPASRSSMPIIEQTSSQCDSHNQSTTIKNQPQNFSNQIPQSSQFSPNPSIINSSQSTSPPPSQPPPAISPTPTAKIGQFKVKPTAALMPEDKSKIVGSNIKISSFKKKIRKSPAGSPLSPEQIFGAEQTGREEVQSPAYSDISDDGAPPVIEPDTDKKNAKKTETGQPLPHLPQFGMYPFYGQQQYLLPPVPQQPQEKNKECADKLNDKPCDKDVKKENPVDFQQQPQPKIVHPQQHYYPYGYMPQGYPYNMDTNYSAGVPLVQEEKIKEERVKTSPSPVMENKQPTPISNPIRVPTPGKVKQEPNKDKHQNDNHQILKESIEIKNQMNPYMYPRQQAPPPPVSHHGHREDDPRRFYPYDQQRRKEQSQPQQGQTQSTPEPHKGSSSKNVPIPSPNLKSYKESKSEDKKEKEIKQEGVKPTMETQGPPPPPTSQYAYIHPSFMQSPHYGALSFDPSHPMYRGIVVPGAYTANPYLQLPRYHAPEDLSRPPPTKALDMLQHHAQYYSSHKIHELQERAIKSPTPKTSSASASPSTNSNSTTPSSGGVPPSSQMVTQPSTTNCSASSGGKQTPGESGKDSRSPPPQRHVHTHHHTHVGLGYPMYPAPYGAAVLASQQAAAVTVINPYPTK